MIPFVGYYTYGAVTNLLQWHVTVTLTTLAFNGTPNPNLTNGQWDNETVTVTTTSSFASGLHIAVDNQTAAGQTTSFTVTGANSVYVRVDGIQLSRTNTSLDNLVFASPPKTISNGSTFQVSIVFYDSGNYLVNLSLN